jgi:hypothetical protein
MNATQYTKLKEEIKVEEALIARHKKIMILMEFSAEKIHSQLELKEASLKRKKAAALQYELTRTHQDIELEIG